MRAGVKGIHVPHTYHPLDHSRLPLKFNLPNVPIIITSPTIFPNCNCLKPHAVEEVVAGAAAVGGAAAASGAALVAAARVGTTVQPTSATSRSASCVSQVARSLVSGATPRISAAISSACITLRSGGIPSSSASAAFFATNDIVSSLGLARTPYPPYCIRKLLGPTFHIAWAGVGRGGGGHGKGLRKKAGDHQMA